MKLARLLIIPLLLCGQLGFVQKAFAQQAVRTLPSTRNNSPGSNGSGTIAVTNTFQLLFAANPVRVTCLIQNNGTNKMYVYFGTPASATLTNSIILAAGWSIPCTSSLITSTDNISITGTSGDGFYASQQ